MQVELYGIKETRQGYTLKLERSPTAWIQFRLNFFNLLMSSSSAKVKSRLCLITETPDSAHGTRLIAKGERIFFLKKVLEPHEAVKDR